MKLSAPDQEAIAINLRLAAVRRVAYEAADAGLLSPELAAGIRRVKGVRRLGVRLGNWLTIEQGRRLLGLRRRGARLVPWIPPYTTKPRPNGRGAVGGATARLAFSSTVPIIVTVSEDLNPQPPYAAATLLKPFPLPALLDEVRRALRARM